MQPPVSRADERKTTDAHAIRSAPNKGRSLDRHIEISEFALQNAALLWFSKRACRCVNTIVRRIIDLSRV
ncbi:hypothetical protein [Rhizobium hidalgonense]|uniref:Uncharacterized protein n=1 Tax=Rhizobium hidalgonense TaxID=1538159 RepID=A0A2A6KLL0_9HYPH|nr:hypothetical protein [Rhizobium hidalgonense]MDR9771429.1 hypothetical protein [Rhizobium hidalgonense]MDR9803519.1 hypothetical protein [Rhizobium hidalgonense]MDR9809014.1 hypothetical protein [Rhizobium hidalgonense]MDR9818540.1 hypothetical protein [Rhizobium hidalgonense]PDT25420.1 hypothetical protein CO674_00960 [Rhizobium hidalgonense]